MSRYSTDDNYCYPGTRVLVNKFDIHDFETLLNVEAELVSMRCVELAKQKYKPPFDIKTLKNIHQFLFGDIYNWAGEFRTVDIAKSGTQFANVKFLESSLKELFTKLQTENFLENLELSDFAKKITYYMSELNAIHPFRDGNGRTQREFINLLSYDSGYLINWSNIDSDLLLEYTIKAFNGQLAELEQLITQNLLKN